MGVLCLHTGTMSDAEPWFQKAEALGYRGGSSDRIFRAIQSRFAVTDGRIDDKLRSRPSGTGDCFVYLVNDDKTPMEFVVWVLEHAFDKTHVQARDIMLAVHEHGSALCGAYDREGAEARVDRATVLARKLGYPLTCRIASTPEP